MAPQTYCASKHHKLYMWWYEYQQITNQKPQNTTPSFTKPLPNRNSHVQLSVSPILRPLPSVHLSHPSLPCLQPTVFVLLPTLKTNTVGNAHLCDRTKKISNGFVLQHILFFFSTMCQGDTLVVFDRPFRV